VGRFNHRLKERHLSAHLYHGGDVGGVLDDLEDPAIAIADRVVRGLDPDLLAALAETLVLAGVKLSAVELRPELAIFGAVAIRLLGEHRVMLAADLFEGVA